jgi:PKD domain-containing protein
VPRPTGLRQVGPAADEGHVTPHRIPRAARAPGRALAPLLGGLVALLASLLLAASPASAIVIHVKVGAGTDTVGVQPTFKALPLDGNGKSLAGGPNAANYNNPTGNPVMHTVNTYVVYWDPQDLYHGEWQGLIDRYMSDLSGVSETGANDVFTVDTQYTDLTGRVGGATRFDGAYTDTAPYPVAGCEDEYLPALPKKVTCLSDAQIQEQLHNFIAVHKLQAGVGTLFFVLTPPGVGVCVGSGPSQCSQDNEEASAGGLCSYHSYYTDPQAGTVLYAAIPWTAGDFGGFPGETSGDLCQTGEYVEKEGSSEFEKSNAPQEPNQLPGLGADGLYDEGLADLIVGQMGAEQQNTITDPLLNGWQDREKLGAEEVGYENTDECRGFFLVKTAGSWNRQKHTEAGTASNQELGENNFFLINDAFNLAALKLSYPGIPCMRGIYLIPTFTEPPTVKSGEVVGFNGMESDITLNAGERFTAGGEEKITYPTFTWDFGDGTPTISGFAPGGPESAPSFCDEPWLTPCAASVFHSYQYGGVYNVTLTVTDISGNTATYTHPITVDGPPPPTPPPPVEPIGGSGGGSGSGLGAGGTGGSSVAPVVPGPVATATAVSSSIRQAVRSGLVVHYEVNEQVAGHFEVLLDAATAHRLKISGPVATALPPGYAKSLVIGKALLVTTKGGHSSVRIRFSKHVAARLRHAHSVTLTLRLIVHNASSSSPVSTSVISTVVLHG